MSESPQRRTTSIHLLNQPTIVESPFGSPIRNLSQSVLENEMNSEGSSDPEAQHLVPQSGPYAVPTSPRWRRERLLGIGTSSSDVRAAAGHTQEPSATTLLARAGGDLRSYGSVASPSRWNGLGSTRRRRTLPHLSSILHSGDSTGPTSPGMRRSRSSTFFNLGRPLTAYDAPIEDKIDSDDDSEDELAKSNGIRVWYSSFSSIDWVHDAIKDSNRIFRLRKRKSLRGRVRNLVDRSLGWIVVTIVGFITAIVAFLIVRSEQWLFDSKMGRCTESWYKAKRFCCPNLNSTDESCESWKTWAEVFNGNGYGLQQWSIEFISYAVIALTLALTSALLTIHFSASTSFVGRKDSGVLSPTFADGVEDTKTSPASHPGEQKRKVMYFAAGSGIPEVKTILSGFVIHGYLGVRTLVVKCVGLALSVASGLSLGKEGPLVQIASCIGNIVSRYFMKYENNEGKRREILSAASAAGVAVAFGAPIGGVLFSLEEVSYFFPAKVMWRSFFCAMIAAVTLRFLDPFGTGKLVLFQVTYEKDWHAFELVFFLIIGLFGGFYGAYFSKANYWWTKNVRGKTWLQTHPVSEVFLVTLVTTMFCFLNPYTRMGGTELVYNLFAECRPGESHEGLCTDRPADVGPIISAIGIAMIVKGLLTVVTFGIKVPAGIFIPTLGVGACFGRIVGLVVQYWQWKNPHSSMFRVCNGDSQCIIPGMYAMVGAAATLSGVTRTTVSLAVIMFELTDTLTYVVPVMLAVLAAKTLADAIEPKGIYDLVIELAQLPYLDCKSEHLWGGLQAGDAAVRDVETIRLDKENTVKTLRDQLQAAVSAGFDDGGFPILQREPGGSKMIGYIGVSELEHALTLVADDADAACKFHGGRSRIRDTTSSISSWTEYPTGADPFDFTVYMDHAPLSVSTHTPLELVHQLFAKLGARYIIVISDSGFFEGVIDKKTWVAFIGELEEKS